MELIGIVAVSIVAAIVVFWSIGFPYMLLGFGGPTASNSAFMILGIIVAGTVGTLWWHFVGTNIHISFG